MPYGKQAFLRSAIEREMVPKYTTDTRGSQPRMLKVGTTHMHDSGSGRYSSLVPSPDRTQGALCFATKACSSVDKRLTGLNHDPYAVYQPTSVTAEALSLQT